MADWIITAPGTGNDKWAVRLADCTSEHAQSVLEHLEGDASVPNGLVLTPTDSSWLRRLIGG